MAPQPATDSDPFPLRPVLGLALAMFAHCYALSSLFPYVAYQVVWMGAAPDLDRSGYYSGFVTAAFMLGRTAASYPLGRLVDHVGRKPVILVGLCSVGLFSVLFGLASDVYTAIGWRLALGLTNGIVVGAKTSVTEVCSERHQPRGVGLVLGAFAASMIFGPAAGGMLAMPAEQWPALFGGTVFDTYPFLLPNAIGAALCVFAIPLVALYVPETAARRNEGGAEKAAVAQQAAAPERRRSQGEQYATVGDDKDEPEPAAAAKAPAKRGAVGTLLALPYVAVNMAVYAVYSGVELGMNEVICLWAVSTVKTGGLGLSAHRLGHVLACIGVAMCLVNLFVYPRLVRRFGPRNCVVGPLCANVPAIAAVPFVSLLRYSPEAPWLCPLLLGLCGACIKCSDSVFFAAVTTMANNAVPLELRGRFQGINMVSGSIGKCLGPAVGASAFAWSIADGPGHEFAFIGYATTTLLVAVVAARSLAPTAAGKGGGGGGGGPATEEAVEAELVKLERGELSPPTSDDEALLSRRGGSAGHAV